ANRFVQSLYAHLRTASRDMPCYGADGLAKQGQAVSVMERCKRADTKIAERGADMADAAGDVDGRKTGIVAGHDGLHEGAFLGCLVDTPVFQQASYLLAQRIVDVGPAS